MLQLVAQLYDTELVAHYGLTTYLVLLASWALVAGAFFLLERSQVAEFFRRLSDEDTEKRDKPQVTAFADLGAPGLMVVVNWFLLLPCILAAAPLLKWLFPADAEAPRVWQVPFITMAWLLIQDASGFLYQMTLAKIPGVGRWLSRPYHPIQTRFPTWRSHALRPGEVLMEAVGAMAGPILWSAILGLPIHAWWLWLGLFQMQVVTMHSGFSLPSIRTVVAIVHGIKQPSRKSATKKTQKDAAKGAARKDAGGQARNR